MMSPQECDRVREEIRMHLDAIQESVSKIVPGMDRARRTGLVVEVNRRLQEIHVTARNALIAAGAKY